MPKPTQNGFYLALLCAGLVLAGGAAHSMANTKAGNPTDMLLSVTAAQQLFSDAPDGVDPMVTGPVSAAFEKRQKDAGCAKATWPNVPTTCYPG
ncbi:hypothetical protein ACFPLB_15180 [Aquamicrobium segne]|uniref:Uncharacterized protein n=1 Tax=Aquamicrobium segne TaxID=469547 RepID=A0ABW0H0J3_9HYPH